MGSGSALAEAVAKKGTKTEKAKPEVVNVNTDQPMKRRGNPNIGNLRRAEKQPKLAPDGREIPEGFSYKKKTGEITPVVKRENPVERRSPAEIRKDLEERKERILANAAEAVAKLDTRLANLDARYEEQIKVEQALTEGKTPEQIEAEAQEAIQKARALKKALKKLTAAR